MSQFSRSRGMHQYYRDVFTRVIYLPETDALPAHIVAEIMTFKSADIAHLEPMIRAAQTDLDADNELVNLWREAVCRTADEWDYLQDNMSATVDSGWACYLALKTKGLLIGLQLAWKKQLQRFLRTGRVENLEITALDALLLCVSESPAEFVRSHQPDVRYTASEQGEYHTRKRDARHDEVA